VAEIAATKIPISVKIFSVNPSLVKEEKNKHTKYYINCTQWKKQISPKA